MADETDRYAELRAIAVENRLDAVALVPGANFHRLFGKDFHQNERALVVLIPAAGSPVAVVPNLEMASFAPLGFEGPVFDYLDNDGPQAAFDAALDALPLRRLGVEGQRMRVMDHHSLKRAAPDLEIVDAHAAISTPRLKKTPSELAALERAIAISEAALERTLRQIEIGQSEVEVEAILAQNLFGCGAEDFAFAPIVAAAGNSAKPHAKARPDYTLRAGDALLLDFGARWGGLNADITRTVFVGHCPEAARGLYETVLSANAKGRALAGPGVTCHELDDAVLSVLEDSVHRDFIRTKTGHGLGREVHEDPYIMRGNSTPLEPGMVFTIEPGLYRPEEIGVRIEDDVLITEEGSRSLTGFPREVRLVAT